MVDILLFLLFLFFFAWMVYRLPFIYNCGLKKHELWILFGIKVLAGVMIGWISYHLYSPDNDYWDNNKEGWKEFLLLANHPSEFLSNITTSGYGNADTGIFGSANSWWNDMENTILYKIISLLDIFSRGNYYVNSIAFSFIAFLGHISLFRFFSSFFPGRRNVLIFGCFLLPSVIYFSSGIHRDAIVFCTICLIFYLFNRCCKRSFTIKRNLILLLSFTLLFLFRNFAAILLVPALAYIFLIQKTSIRPVWIFSGIYMFSILLAFTAGKILPLANIPAAVCQKQLDYYSLPKTKSTFRLDTLHPDLQSFASSAPLALARVLGRPFFMDMKEKVNIPASLEMAFYGLLFLSALFFHRPINSIPPPVWGGILFSFSILLLVGYISPNLGTLVRYRSLYLPWLIVPLICLIKWKNSEIKH